MSESIGMGGGTSDFSINDLMPSVRKRPPNLFHPVNISDIKKVKHTHIEITATVDKAHNETDGDVHLHVSDGCNGLICEIIPEIPLSIPKIGSKVKISGILRFDKEHNWSEIHPCLKIEVI